MFEILANEFEVIRKKYLNYYRIGAFFFVMFLLLWSFLCFAIPLKEIFDYFFIGIGDEKKAVDNFIAILVLSLVLYFIYWIIITLLKRYVNDLFINEIRQKLISNVNMLQDIENLKIEKYFDTYNPSFWYDLAKDLFMESNVVKVHDAFLIKYKGYEITVWDIEIGKEVGMGKNSKYYTLFRGTFIRVPPEVATEKKVYRDILYKDYKVFVIDKLLPFHKLPYLDLFENIKSEKLKEEVENFSSYLKELISIVSQVIKQDV